MPIGAASKRDRAVIITVFIIAGIIETFSLLYFHAKSEGLMFGTPLISIYATRKTTTAAVSNAASQVISSIISEPG